MTKKKNIIRYPSAKSPVEANYLNDFEEYLASMLNLMDMARDTVHIAKSNPVRKVFEYSDNEKIFLSRKGKKESEKIKLQRLLSFRSTIIYQLSLFERIKNKNLKVAMGCLTSVKKFVTAEFAKAVQKNNKDGFNSPIGKLMLFEQDKIKDNLDKYPYLLSLEKSVYRLIDSDSSKSTKISGILNVYIIFRELRNLFVHRSKKLDKKFFKSLESSGSKAIDSSIKGVESILYPAKKLKMNNEVELSVISLFMNHFNLIKLSFIYFTRAFGKRHKDFITEQLSGLINEYLNLAETFDNYFLGKVIRIELRHVVLTLQEHIFDEIDWLHPILNVNAILIFDSNRLKYRYSKDQAKVEDISDHFNTLINRHLEIIGKKNKLIKKIIESYLKKDIVNFINAVELYCEKFNINHQSLAEWFMIRKLDRLDNIVSDHFNIDL